MTPAAVRTARRSVSGRATGPARATGDARPAAADRARAAAADRARATNTGRARAPRLPRRLSGPIGGRARAQAAPGPIATLGERALAVVRSLPDRSLIDRLVRGRAWIPVLGVLLAGLVAMQVEILKLGTSIGRSIERSTALQSRNESLQAGVATLADDQRIERLAGGMGMATPSPSSVVFVPANAQHAVGRALANIHAPDPAGFASQLAAQIAATAMVAPAAPGAATTAGTALTAATPGPTATVGASTSTETAPESAQAAPGTTAATSQSATGPATSSGDAAQTPPTSGPGGTTAASPTVEAPGSAATGAAALAPTSESQSGSSPGG